MPGSPSKVCLHPGCGARGINGTSRCDKHPAKAWTRQNPPDRIRGRKLQAIRKRLFDANPLCVACERQGIVKLATQRDHIIPLGEDGPDDDSNVQGLCVECHRAKSKAESLRGRG